MLRKQLVTWIGVAFVCALSFPVQGEEYELGYKVLDLYREGVYVMEQYPQPRTKSQEKLSAEPKYRSQKPVYIAAEFGNDSDNKYTCVLDESKGTGKGYDTLYVDRNNNENLTDDGKVGGRLRRQGTSYTMASFGPLEVMIDYGDRTVPYSFSFEFYHFGEARASGGGEFVENMRVAIRPGGYYTGVVSFGGSKHRIAAIDYNGNGRFDEHFKPRPHVGPEDRLYAVGDQVLIDANGDGRFDGAYPDYRELYPYAKYVQLSGKWYSLDIAAHGGKVVVETPRLKFGTIRITDPSGSCSLQLLSETGVLKLEGKGQEFQVPAGTYQVYSHGAEVAHSSGRWLYEAQGPTSGKKLEVAEGAVSELRIGPPLLVNVSYFREDRQGSPVKAGDTIRLSFNLSREGGELYTNVQKNGGRPSVPTYKIVDEAGKTVATGSFEWG